MHGCCASCWAGFRVLRAPQCRGCGLPLPGATDLGGSPCRRCPRCLGRRSSIDRVVAAVEYDHRARSVLLRSKAGRRPEILVDMAHQLTAALRAAGVAGDCDVVVAAPSHLWSDLRRGFAPAEELARCLAASLGLSCRPILRRKLLPWGVAKGRSRFERLRLMRGAVFARARIDGARVLLVDDVMTSGTTAESCAVALRRAGGERVVAGVWARTLPPEHRSWSPGQ